METMGRGNRENPLHKEGEAKNMGEGPDIKRRMRINFHCEDHPSQREISNYGRKRSKRGKKGSGGRKNMNLEKGGKKRGKKRNLKTVYSI